VIDLRAAHSDPAGRFFVPWSPFPHRLRDVLRWQLTRLWHRERTVPAAHDLAALLQHQSRDDQPAPRATWVGHATVVLEDSGDTVFLDPHWGPRALVPRRLRPALPPVEEFPAPKFVVLSHDHYDHLDAGTVAKLGPDTTWIVPLGLGPWLRRRGVRRVFELDWFDQLEHEGWRLTCLPAQHWSNRLEHGRGRTLWASWLLEGPSRVAYFGGDSGYFAGFREIASLAPPIDLAILSVGAFAPRWFMGWQHLAPEQAATVWRELGARRLLPVHWGTFDLADDHPDEAPLLLAAALTAPERVRVGWLWPGSAMPW
jgi:N-acyl-phosphatidylethanolamine-hydrolysing phospholipase D